MKKFLFAGFGFLLCGVAMFSLGNALTVEVNPCYGYTTSNCPYYNYTRSTTNCTNSYNNCYYNYNNYNYATTRTVANYNYNYRTAYTSVYRGSYPRTSYSTNYIANRPVTTSYYPTYSNSYTYSTRVAVPVVRTSANTTNYNNTTTYNRCNTGCISNSCGCNNTTTTTVARPVVVTRPTTTYTYTTGSQYYNTYNTTNCTTARIKSVYQGNNTYLITPETSYSTGSWSWNYNSHAVNCEVTYNNALKCVKVSNSFSSEISADFYSNGRQQTSNIINL